MKKFILLILLICIPSLSLACGLNGKPDFRPEQQKFDDWDKNRDGSIDYDEAYKTLPIQGFSAQQDDWKKRLEADYNKNRKIELDEFQRAFPFINC